MVEEEHSCACRADGCLHGLSLVASQIVEDDDVARLEHGDQELLDISKEADGVDRSVEDGWRIDPVMVKCDSMLVSARIPRSFAVATASIVANRSQYLYRSRMSLETIFATCAIERTVSRA